MGKDRRIIAPGKMEGSRLLNGKTMLMGAGTALVISAGIAYLFYDSFWGMFSGIGVLPIAVWVIGREREKRRRQKLNLEFKDYMYAVSGAMMAGYSVERAFQTALEDVRQLYGETSILVQKLDCLDKRLGVKEPLEHILCDFALESGSEDIENFVEVFCYAKRGGGDFTHIIQTTVSRICDKIEVVEEIQTVMAEKVIEQKVMCAVPAGILCFFRFTSPDFIAKLYGSLLGAGIMTAALLLYGAAFLLAVKIVDIEV